MPNRGHVLLASAARTASVNSDDQANPEGRGVIVIIDVTDSASTPSVVATIQGKDQSSGNYYDILVAAAITGAEQRILRVGPELTASANLVARDVMPYTWRLELVAADGDSLTYSVGAIEMI